MADNKKVYFEFDSRILTQLGEKLVPNKAVALAELVKNSYDADATKVIIKGRKIKRPGGTIVIEDNGLGIQESRFQETWMRIATLDKEANPISKKYKRQKSGEKGIGRFACRRLSRKLKLLSVAETDNDEKEQLTVVFNWDDFAPGSDANKVENILSTEIIDKNTPTGTKLFLEDVYESWDGRNINKLRNELSELFVPNLFVTKNNEEDPGFNVEFDLPEFDSGTFSTDGHFFKSAWAKITGHVDENGYATYEIKTINKILTTFRKEFKKTDSFDIIRNIFFECYIFSYRHDLFRNSTWKMDKVREVNEQKGGIKVYADKFKVFGYGGRGDDWLKLDYDRSRSVTGLSKEVNAYSEEDKRPGLRLFRNNSLYGHVMFNRNSNPMLEITINRDRLLENDAYQELSKFARLGIEFATVLYSNEVFKDIQLKDLQKLRIEKERERRAEEERRRVEEERHKAEEERRKAEERARKAEEERRKAEEKARKAEEERRRIEEERRKLEKESWDKSDTVHNEHINRVLQKETELLEIEEIQRRKEYEARIKAEEEKRKSEAKLKEIREMEIQKEEKRRKILEKQIQKKQQKIELELSQLRVLASTGTQVLMLEHELQALIEDMEVMIDNYKLLLQKIPEKDRLIYEEDLDSFVNRIEMIKEFGNFLGLTISNESRLEKKDWVLRPVLEKVQKPFKWYFTTNDISFDMASIPDDLKTPKMYRSELVSVIYNVLANALKATKGRNERRIKVVAYEKENKIFIDFLDSGVGLDEDKWDIVFEPFISDSEPDLRFGVGTGLGLKLVRDIVESYDGYVSFRQPPQNWSTCVGISLPLEENV